MSVLLMVAALVGLVAAYAKGRMDESKRRGRLASLDAVVRRNGLDRIGK